LRHLQQAPTMGDAERDRLTQAISEALASADPNSPMNIAALTNVYAAINRADAALRNHNDFIDGDLELDGYLGLIEQEICLQRKLEDQWGNLVHAMVANCSQIDQSLQAVRNMLDAAITAVAGHRCVDGAPIDLPPALETSLDTLVESVERTGLGRPNRALRLQRRR
jgi:hypothetical protein